MRAFVNGPTLRRVTGNLVPEPDQIWTTIDGRRLKIGEMDEQHVRNALRLVLRRRAEKKEQQLRELKANLLHAQLRRDIEQAALADLDDDRKWGR